VEYRELYFRKLVITFTESVPQIWKRVTQSMRTSGWGIRMRTREQRQTNLAQKHQAQWIISTLDFSSEMQTKSLSLEHCSGLRASYWSVSHTTLYILVKKLNSVACVLERTIPTERPPLVGEVIANFCG
jgi:hypothetical protein